jgi:hypothetical protein
VDNTSLPPAASKIIAGVISVFLHRLALPSVIRNDPCEKIGHRASDKAKNDASAIFVAPYARSADQNQRLGLQIEIKESKTPGGESTSTDQAFNFLSLGVKRQASVLWILSRGL